MPAITGEVTVGDPVQAGVALRAKQDEVLVCPLVFRLACNNGEIRSHAVQGKRIERIGPHDYDTGSDMEAILNSIRKAIRDACSADAFRDGLHEMRSATEMEVDIMFMDLSFRRHVREMYASAISRESIEHCLDRYHREEDRSLYGLMNAITSTARDTDTPEENWYLEELGGAVGARRLYPKSPKPTKAMRVISSG